MSENTQERRCWCCGKTFIAPSNSACYCSRDCYRVGAAISQRSFMRGRNRKEVGEDAWRAKCQEFIARTAQYRINADEPIPCAVCGAEIKVSPSQRIASQGVLCCDYCKPKMALIRHWALANVLKRPWRESTAEERRHAISLYLSADHKRGGNHLEAARKMREAEQGEGATPCKFCGAPTRIKSGFCRACIREGFHFVYSVTNRPSNVADKRQAPRKVTKAELESSGYNVGAINNMTPSSIAVQPPKQMTRDERYLAQFKGDKAVGESTFKSGGCVAVLNGGKQVSMRRRDSLYDLRRRATKAKEAALDSAKAKEQAKNNDEQR